MGVNLGGHIPHVFEGVLRCQQLHILLLFQPLFWKFWANVFTPPPLNYKGRHGRSDRRAQTSLANFDEIVWSFIRTLRLQFELLPISLRIIFNGIHTNLRHHLVWILSFKCNLTFTWCCANRSLLSNTSMALGNCLKVVTPGRFRRRLPFLRLGSGLGICRWFLVYINPCFTWFAHFIHIFSMKEDRCSAGHALSWRQTSTLASAVENFACR